MATLTGQIIGRYRILDRVGQGGMATVYRAYDPVEGRNVAVKVLSTLAAESPHFTARFEREARTVAELRHPNIVPVWDYGEAGGKHYLVMPLLELGSLADRLGNGPIRPRESGRIVEQVCQALDHAHRRGVIHRDIKPSNILLDQDGNALVSDFGLVYIENASISLTGSALIGTPAYMSPEQARGEKVTSATDQYSFGVVLYELATGQLPYDGETPMAVAIKHVTDPLPFPRARNPNVPVAIEQLILKATAKEPADRFDSMAALGEAYRAALEYALDPKSNPPPKIDVPESVTALRLENLKSKRPEEQRRRKLMWLPLTLAMLLLLLLLPGRAPGLLGSLDLFSGLAKGTGLTVADLSGPQLTAMAGTLEVMSTQLAEAQGTSLSPEEMQTAVVGSFLGTQESGGSGFAGPGSSKRSPTPTVGSPSEIAASPAASSSLPPTVTSAPTVPGQPSETAHPSATSGIPATSTNPPPTQVIGTTAVPTQAVSPGLPTWTPSATRTATSSPTATPTWTTAPTFTMTPVPPTATPAVVPCSALWLGGGGSLLKRVWWDLGNDGDLPVEITAISIDWPGSNQRLDEVTLGGEGIWDKRDDSPPTAIDSNWAGGSREIAPGSSSNLAFIFHKLAASSGYTVDVTLDNGCVVSANR